jgi:hypothetical protein
MNVPTFSGAPADVGRAMAAPWRGEWLGVLAHRRAPGRPGGGRPDAERVKRFSSLLSEHAPHWLEEAAAFAGDTLDELLDFNCAKPNPPPDAQAANCSALVATGGATADGHPLLLKVRDESPWPQLTFRRRLKGCLAVLGGANPGNLGVAHFQNEAGLAGANNTGGPILDPDLGVGLNDCHVHRLVAERARDCAEALEVIGELLARKALGLGGYRKGMIFLYADAKGRGLLVECSRTRLARRFLDDGVLARANDYLLPEMAAEMDRARERELWHQSSFARRARLEALLAKAGPLTPAALEEHSRDTAGEFPICNVSDRFPFRTVSAWVHVLRRGDPSACRARVCDVAPTRGSYAEVSVAG